MISTIRLHRYKIYKNNLKKNYFFVDVLPISASLESIDTYKILNKNINPLESIDKYKILNKMLIHWSLSTRTKF